MRRALRPTTIAPNPSTVGIMTANASNLPLKTVPRNVATISHHRPVAQSAPEAPRGKDCRQPIVHGALVPELLPGCARCRGTAGTALHDPWPTGRSLAESSIRSQLVRSPRRLTRWSQDPLDAAEAAEGAISRAGDDVWRQPGPPLGKLSRLVSTLRSDSAHVGMRPRMAVSAMTHFTVDGKRAAASNFSGRDTKPLAILIPGLEAFLAKSIEADRWELSPDPRSFIAKCSERNKASVLADSSG